MGMNVMVNVIKKNQKKEVGGILYREDNCEFVCKQERKPAISDKLLG